MATYYSDKHITACAAYIVGYPALAALLYELGVFDFILPDYTLFDLMGVRTPPGLSLEQTEAVAYVLWASPYSLVYIYLINFVPLALVWGFVTGKIFNDRPASHQRRTHGHPNSCISWCALCWCRLSTTTS